MKIKIFYKKHEYEVVEVDGLGAPFGLLIAAGEVIEGDEEIREIDDEEEDLPGKLTKIAQEVAQANEKRERMVLFGKKPGDCGVMRKAYITTINDENTD